MSWRACTCWVLHCDGCGASLGPDLELHFSSCDPAGPDVVANAEQHAWMTDGERWHCADCPELRQAVCTPCRAGQHSLCEDPRCACALQAPTPGQGTLPFGEGTDA